MNQLIRMAAATGGNRTNLGSFVCQREASMKSSAVMLNSVNVIFSQKYEMNVSFLGNIVYFAESSMKPFAFLRTVQADF